MPANGRRDWIRRLKVKLVCLAVFTSRKNSKATDLRTISGFRRDVDVTRWEWLFRFDISGQAICPIFKGQEVGDLLTVEDGTDRIFWNVSRQLPL